MVNNKNKSIWETAFDTRTAFAKVISLIVIPIMVLIFASEKIGKYNNRCISWSDFKKSKKIELKYEKPIGFEQMDGYYLINFTNNRVIYSCNREIHYSNNYEKIDKNILSKIISKEKGSELIHIYNEKNEEIGSFIIDWTN